ncbi:caspase-3-like [Mytilus edulis]|uniref:caspase-3-like n=1 Tax=Mytilus edulis TaxID=6550 RepID=UPI0039EFA7FF
MEKSIPISSGADKMNLQLPEIYAVSAGKRGFALIINNFEFDDITKNLPGGKQDSVRLKETFEGLQFIVELKENLSGTEIESRIIAYSQYETLSRYNCFVCVLSSHGAYDKLIGRDGAQVHLPTVLGTILNCKYLIGQPKLFFIDACRNLDPHFNLEIPLPYPDYMICYSALPGTSAYMMNGTTDRFEGSRFIKSMCDVLCEYGEDEQLAHLLIRIKKAVNDKNGHVEYEQNVQSRDSLTKRCFFKPGKWICEVCYSCIDTDVCLQCKPTSNTEGMNSRTTTS